METRNVVAEAMHNRLVFVPVHLVALSEVQALELALGVEHDSNGIKLGGIRACDYSGTLFPMY